MKNLLSRLLSVHSESFSVVKNNPENINDGDVFFGDSRVSVTNKFSDYNILITATDNVYVWGSNKYGQIGLKDTKNRNEPTKNVELENIITQNGGAENIRGLYIGRYHNILIFKNGKVYVWGRNYEGQLGLGDTNNRLTPVENVNLENIIAQNGGASNIQGLYVGIFHNILIFKNGKVYVWGGNGFGQLGLGYPTTSRPYGIPTPVENTVLENIIDQNGGAENIQKLHVGAHYNILIFKSGRVYVWGRNDYGQLGLGDTDSRATPTENTNLEDIIMENKGVENIRGLYSGWSHNILIFRNNKVYVWGYNRNGELGIIDINNKLYPIENTILKIIITIEGGADNIYSLYIGGGHNILIFKNGMVCVWGNNWFGQLALHHDNITYPKVLISPFRSEKLREVIFYNGGVGNIVGCFLSSVFHKI